MKIVISENQFVKLNDVEDRPVFTDIDFIVETEGDEEDTHNVGEPGEPDEHSLYFFFIAEKFYDAFYDETYLELFNQYSDQEECDPFVNAVIDRILEKIKESILNDTAKKILKKVIKNQKVVRFRLSDIKNVLEKHFSNIICHEFKYDLK